MKITQEKFQELYEIASKKTTFTFNADWAIYGANNSSEHAKYLYKIFLELMSDIEQPIILATRKVCGYFISTNLMAGLFGKVNSIMKVGELLQNNNRYNIFSSSNGYCKSCGAPVGDGVCEYCGIGEKVNFGSVNIFAIPENFVEKIIPEYHKPDNFCLLVSYDLTDSNLLIIDYM